MSKRAVVALLLPLLACSGSATPQTPPPPVEPAPAVSSTPAPSPAQHVSPTPEAAPTPAPAVPQVSPQDRAQIAGANNAFGADLWQRLRSSPGNLVVSPASLSIALGMTWGGARGETAAQMKRVLHFNLDDAPTHAALASQIAAWNAPGARPYELRVANRLFGGGTTFEPAFLALTRDSYGAPIETVSFATPEPARAHINEWVEQQTNRRIVDLLPPGSLSDLTRLVLTNAVYFKGSWESRFDAARTAPQRFTTGAGRAIDVQMMHQAHGLRFAHVDGLKVLELPYSGGDLAMVVVLPDAVNGLAAVEARATAVNVSRWIAALAQQEVDVEVALPRFRFAGASLSLGQHLVALGMPLAFGSQADFSGISPEPGLQISEVFHKTFVEVNEEGTEAAAASAVEVAVRGMPVAPPEPPRFVADHPFLFFIRDVRSGAILFWGRIVDPS